MSDTLKSLRNEIIGLMRGDYESDSDIPVVNSCINDAIESIWTSIIQVRMAKLLGLDSPVTFTLASGTERVRLVSIQDPTNPLILSGTAGGNLPGRQYNVSFTWVTESGSETLPNPVVNQNVGANQLLMVQLPSIGGGYSGPPVGAIGYNLYVGQQNQALQNQQPITPLPSVPGGPGVPYIEPITGFQDYPTFQQQPPILNTTGDNISFITHMEHRTSDQALHAWNRYDLDSMIMRRFARTLASSSEFQNYVWELNGDGTLEFRPMTGTAFTPRYWYVARPRRLRYDQSEIPYVGITGVHEFLKAYAIAQLKLSLDEYLANQAWDTRAEKARLGIVLALTEENVNRNNRIKPYLY